MIVSTLYDLNAQVWDRYVLRVTAYMPSGTTVIKSPVNFWIDLFYGTINVEASEVPYRVLRLQRDDFRILHVNTGAEIFTLLGDAE